MFTKLCRLFGCINDLRPGLLKLWIFFLILRGYFASIIKGMNREQKGKTTDFLKFQFPKVLINIEYSQNQRNLFHHYSSLDIYKNGSSLVFSIIIDLRIAYYYPNFRHKVIEAWNFYF